MPQTAHLEKHFMASDVVRDLVIGMSDGLTVPFALAAGLAGAASATNLIITAGLAEIAAGSIAMGLGGYLAAKSDAEYYVKEHRREELEIKEQPLTEAQEIIAVLQTYGVSEQESKPVVDALRRNPQAWVAFMMRFELGLEQPNPKRALTSAITIAGAYIAGGLIPLAPYFFLSTISQALLVSAMATLAALTIFGYIKGQFTGTSPLKSAAQTALIGGLAASVAFAIARVIQ